MKNIYLALFLVLAGLTACEEDYKDWADPQTNPQEDRIDIAFQAANTSVTEFDLAKVTAETVAIIQQSSLSNEGTSVTYTVQIANEETFANKLSYEPLVDGTTFSITTAELVEAVTQLYGRRPTARDLYVRLDAGITTGPGTVLKARSNHVIIAVTPEAPPIETAYYLVGGPTGWNGSDISTLAQFSHSGSDVYEDPFFTLLVNVGDDGGWKIVPQSAVTAVEAGEANDIWGAAMGTDVDGDTSLEGAFASGKGGAMKIDQPGWAKITLDMMNYTYSVELIGEMALELYVPGGYQGWSAATAPIVYTQNTDMRYDGYINVIGDDLGFKFINGPDWANEENGYTEYGLNADGDFVAGGSNVTVSETGYYRLTVDLSGSEYSYSVTKTTWEIIGDATAGGWDAATVMAFDATTGLWTVTAPLTAGGTFKFRANNGWDINLGGDLNNLTYGGDNIPVTEAGEYLITLDLRDPRAYKATAVKQ